MNCALYLTPFRSPLAALCFRTCATTPRKTGANGVIAAVYSATRSYSQNHTRIAKTYRTLPCASPWGKCLILPSPLGYRSYAKATSPSEVNSQKAEEVDSKQTTEETKDLEYEDWREYDPQYGIPLPDGILDQASITRIFGSDVDEEEGNFILSVLQYRRLSGSLVEAGVSFPDLTHSRETYILGLEYLRETYPIDEEANATVWLEEETRKIEQEELMNRAVKIGIYKRDEAVQEGSSHDLYGKSVFVEMRKRNEARWEQEQKEKAEKEAQLTAEMRKAATPKALQTFRDPDSGHRLPTLVGLQRLHELRSEERTKYNEEMLEKARLPQQPHDTETPTIKRLWSSTLITAATIALCVFFADTYTPPSQAARLFADITPSTTTCLTLVGLNLAVFIAWRIPPAWKFLSRSVIVAPAWPRAVALLGNLFSHQTGSHFLTNMIFLGLVGPPLHDIVDRGNFLAIYLAAGVLGAYSSLVYRVLTRNFTAYSQGASGALYGVLAAFCLLTDKKTIAVPFTEMDVPFNYTWLLAFCFAIDVAGMVFKRTRGIDHVAHLTGFASGALGSFLIQKKVEMQKSVELAHKTLSKPSAAEGVAEASDK